MQNIRKVESQLDSLGMCIRRGEPEQKKIRAVKRVTWYSNACQIFKSDWAVSLEMKDRGFFLLIVFFFQLLIPTHLSEQDFMTTIKCTLSLWPCSLTKKNSKLLSVAWHHTSKAGDLVLFVFAFYLFCMMVIYTKLRDPGLKTLSDMTARRTAQLKANFQVDYFKFYDPASPNLI